MGTNLRRREFAGPDLLRTGDMPDLVDRSDMEDYVREQTAPMRRIESSVTYSIPGDFPTLQAAIDRLGAQPIRANQVINLMVESGHKPTKGILADNGNFSQFRVTSQLGPIILSDAFEDDSFIYAHFADAPVLAALVRGHPGTPATTPEARIGVCYHMQQGSRGWVESGAGGIFFENGLECGGASSVYALGTQWTDNMRGIRVQQASHVTVQSSDASRCSIFGLYASRASVVNMMWSVARDCGVAAQIRRSFVNLNELDGSGAVTNGLELLSHCFVNCAVGTFSNCGSAGIYMDGGSKALLGSGEASNNGTYGVRLTEGAWLSAIGGRVQGNAIADVRMETGATLMGHSMQTTTGLPALADVSGMPGGWALNQTYRSGILYG